MNFLKKLSSSVILFTHHHHHHHRCLHFALLHFVLLTVMLQLSSSSAAINTRPKLVFLGENADTLYIRLSLATETSSQQPPSENVKSQMEQRAIQISNIAALLLRPLNIMLYLIEHRFVTSRELEAQGSTELLGQIQRYRSFVVDRNNADIDIFHVLKSNADVNSASSSSSIDTDRLGQALTNGICSMFAVSYCANFNVNATSSLVPIAATMAHEIGHLLGLKHDEPGCTCSFSPDGTTNKINNSSHQCIMVAGKSTFGAQPLAWSSCSIKRMEEIRKRLPPYCLRQRPAIVSKQTKQSICGNGVVEEGEQCDCGSPEIFQVWAKVALDGDHQTPPCSPNCCDMTTCKFLRKNATCATGQCCQLDTCQVFPKHTLCRPSADECDLPEYCDGGSEFCPVNLHKATGYGCKDGEGVCFAGNCHTRTEQCRQLWGDMAYDGDATCYAENRKGRQEANCGHQRTVYEKNGEMKAGHNFEKCPTVADSFCGTLKCGGIPSSTKAPPLFVLPLLSDNRNGCAYTIAAMMPDYGMVRNGTKCRASDSFDGICLANRCVSLNDTVRIVAATLEANNNNDDRRQELVMKLNKGSEEGEAVATRCGCSDSTRCVCNDVGSRHCMPGYEPPLCDLPGCGGSLESNSPGRCSPVRDFMNEIVVIAISVLLTIFGLSLVFFMIVVIFSQDRRFVVIRKSIRNWCHFGTNSERRRSPAKDEPASSRGHDLSVRQPLVISPPIPIITVVSSPTSRSMSSLQRPTCPPPPIPTLSNNEMIGTSNTLPRTNNTSTVHQSKMAENIVSRPPILTKPPVPPPPVPK